jgi:hypothetical protein
MVTSSPTRTTSWVSRPVSLCTQGGGIMWRPRLGPGAGNPSGPVGVAGGFENYARNHLRTRVHDGGGVRKTGRIVAELSAVPGYPAPEPRASGSVIRRAGCVAERDPDVLVLRSRIRECDTVSRVRALALAVWWYWSHWPPRSDRSGPPPRTLGRPSTRRTRPSRPRPLRTSGCTPTGRGC